MKPRECPNKIHTQKIMFLFKTLSGINRNKNKLSSVPKPYLDLLVVFILKQTLTMCLHYKQYGEKDVDEC